MSTNKKLFLGAFVLLIVAGLGVPVIWSRYRPAGAAGNKPFPSPESKPTETGGPLAAALVRRPDEEIAELPVQACWLAQWQSPTRYALSLENGSLDRLERLVHDDDDPRVLLQPIGDLAWKMLSGNPKIIVGSGRSTVLPADVGKLSDRDLSAELQDLPYLEGEALKPGAVFLVKTRKHHYALVYFVTVHSTFGGQLEAYLAWLYQPDGTAQFSPSSVRSLLEKGRVVAAKGGYTPPEELMTGTATLFSQGTPQANVLDVTIGKTRPAPEKKPAVTVYQQAFASPSSPAYAAIVDYNSGMAAASDLFYDQDGERLVAASGVITALREVGEESLSALDDDIDAGPMDAEKAGRGGPAALMSYQTSPGSALAFQTRGGRWVVARVLKREQGGLVLHWVMQPDGSSRFPSIDTVLRDIEKRPAAKPITEQLYQAVQDNAASPDKVASLIDDFVKSGADINALVEPVGDGALHAAVLYGVPSTVDALLNAGARVDLRSRGGATALHYAATFGRTDNAKILLSHGADPLAQMPDGSTATQIASQARPENPELVALLLSHIDRSVMPLSTAASVGDVQAVQAAMDRKEPIDGVDGRGFTPLYFAASKGHLEVVELLVKAGANPYAVSSPRRLSPFVAAITNDHGKVAEAMLAEGIPKDTNVAMTALSVALRKDMTGLVVQLINRLPGKESREHAKQLVLELGSESTVRAVVEDMSTVPLWVAARIGAVDALKQILEGKPDLAEFNSDGLTALHVAVQNGNVECASLLLSAGANPNVPTVLQRATALHFSAMGGGREIIDELLRRGADVNAVSKEGFTPLYYAVMFRRAEVVKTLLEHRAALKDVPEPSGLTNLVRMAGDDKDIVKLLKRSGAVRSGAVR